MTIKTDTKPQSTEVQPPVELSTAEIAQVGGGVGMTRSNLKLPALQTNAAGVTKVVPSGPGPTF